VSSVKIQKAAVYKCHSYHWLFCIGRELKIFQMQSFRKLQFRRCADFQKGAVHCSQVSKCIVLAQKDT